MKRAKKKVRTILIIDFQLAKYGYAEGYVMLLLLCYHEFR
jgi:hypothetical protein